MLNRSSSIAAALLALGTVCAGSAQAADVHWSVGINLPAVGTVISNAPVYYPPAPVYYPAPVVVQPAPVVVYRPAPVVYHQAPPQVVYRPVPVYAPRYYGPGVIRTGWAVPAHGGKHDGRHGNHGRHDQHGDRHDDHRGDRRQHH
jgi:hypothetical protein